MDIKLQIEAAYLDLDRWIDNNGWAGYDPFDIRGQDWYVRLLGREDVLSHYVRSAVGMAESRLPQLGLRKALNVKPAINAKAIGLLATAYLARYWETKDQNSLQKAQRALSWLNQNRSASSTGIAWGYPFHWNSRIFIPRGTPSGVVTGVVGDAFLDNYEITGDPDSLEVASGISRFILEELNRPVDQPATLCFSYTPLDDFKVLNASLYSAAFLARLGSILENEEMLAIARRAAAYVVSEQNPDGSFYYWGSEPPTHIDHFHTGFVLRHLDTVMKCCSADFIDAPLQKGYEFYKTRLFENGIPKNTPDSLYPIDIHSCAEALICLSRFETRYGGHELIQSVFDFCTGRMRHPDGYYVADIRRSVLGERRTEIPYMRWGQAWMLLAFARASCG
jgi:hypothetical protein